MTRQSAIDRKALRLALLLILANMHRLRAQMMEVSK